MRLRKFGLVLTIAVGAFLALTASAFAGPSAGNGDPQATNAPYVAWVGNQVRLAKCFWSDDVRDPKATQDGLAGLLAVHAALTQGTFSTMDWSGDVNQKPQFLNGNQGSNSVNGTIETQGHDGAFRVGLCYSIHVASDKPGLQVVKLAISPAFGPLLGAFLGHDVAIKHDFFNIWLTSTTPQIVEVDDKSPGGYMVGDPAGDGKFQPPYEGGLKGVKGLVNIRVKGTFPLGNNWAPLGLGTVTLPDDWATLANALAFDTGGRNAMAWDIHDGLSWTQTPHALVGPYPPHPVTQASFEAGKADHYKGNGCVGASNTSTDAVDNCLGIFGLLYNDGSVSADADVSLLSDLYGYGPFSSLFGVHPAIGPFDQLREYSSLFSDGILDAGDAPMPALRVDVKLGAGSIGSLEKADKEDIYITDETVAGGFPHNLYAPFYKAYIPAVGIAGCGEPAQCSGSEPLWCPLGRCWRVRQQLPRLHQLG